MRAWVGIAAALMVVACTATTPLPSLSDDNVAICLGSLTVDPAATAAALANGDMRTIVGTIAQAHTVPKGLTGAEDPRSVAWRQTVIAAARASGDFDRDCVLVLEANHMLDVGPRPSS